MSQIKLSIEGIRRQQAEILTSKADQPLLERLREQLLTKVDLEYVTSLVGQAKQEVLA